MEKEIQDCILLVDDDDATNFFSKRLIESIGLKVNVHVTENGQEALDFLLKNGKYQETNHLLPLFIFLDLNMPVMDGWEFLDAFEKLNIKSKVIVMLTTSLNQVDIEKSKTYTSIFRFIKKPLQKHDILEVFSKNAP
jgi:CheY-like chemotaxis protein